MHLNVSVNGTLMSESTNKIVYERFWQLYIAAYKITPIRCFLEIILLSSYLM